MTEVWVNKEYEVDGSIVEVDYELHKTLCALASKFYAIKGYESSPEFDFSESNHPLEKQMYLFALTAYVFNGEVGLD